MKKSIRSQKLRLPIVMKEKFVVKIGANLAFQVLNLIVAYLKIVYLDVRLVGILGFAVSWAGLFSMFVDLGLERIHYQYASKDDFADYFGTYLGLKSLLAGFNYTLPFLLLLFINFEPLTRQVISIVLVTNVFNVLSQIFVTHLQTKMKVFKIEVPRFALSLGSTGALVFIILNSDRFANPLLWIVGIDLIYYVLYFLVMVGLTVREAQFARPEKKKIKEYFRDARPLIIQSIIFAVYQYLGLVIFGLAYGEEELAYFFVVKNYIISILLLTVSQSLNIMLFSILPRLFAENDVQSITEITNTCEKYASFFFLFLVIFVELNAEIVFELVLPQYMPSVAYLRWLIWIPYLEIIVRPYLGNLIQGKRQRLSATISIVEMLGTIACTVIFVPREFLGLRMLGWGAYGLILVDFIFKLYSNVAYRVAVGKIFGVKTYIARIGVHLGIGAGVFLLSWWVKEAFLVPLISNSFLLLAVSTALSFGLYLGGFLLTREMTVTDLKYLVSLLKTRNYLLSFREEIASKPAKPTPASEAESNANREEPNNPESKPESEPGPTPESESAGKTT